MPRSIWNGTITFGLIAVPIKVHSATEDRSVHFHQVHAADGARIKQKRMCSKEHKEVPFKQVARGYELRGGKYVLLSKDEIDAAAGERSHLIELEQFVGADQIDPVFYDRTYYLGPGDDGQDAYRLMHDALERTERVGIGRWVFHNREYLAAVRAFDKALALHTMLFADELVDAGELEIPKPSRAPSKREIEMAGQLVESLHEDFDADAFHDSYRERVLELIETKAAGKEPDLPAPEEREAAPDLAAALEASLGASGERRPWLDQAPQVEGKELTMPRSLWTGSLSFGLVNVPVRVVPAVRDQDLHFRQLHEKDGAPIEVQRWCSEEDVEVPFEEITRGYELDDGGQVLVSDLELEAIEPRRTRTIEIERFVDLEQVDPTYFDHPVLPGPGVRRRRRPPRLPAADRGDEPHRPSCRGPVRDARQGVSGDRPRARRGADADHDAVRRRGPADQGCRRSHRESPQAHPQAARRGDLGDRGAVGRLGPGLLQGRVPVQAQARRRPQA